MTRIDKTTVNFDEMERDDMTARDAMEEVRRIGYDAPRLTSEESENDYRWPFSKKERRSAYY